MQSDLFLHSYCPHFEYRTFLCWLLHSTAITHTSMWKNVCSRVAYYQVVLHSAGWMSIGTELLNWGPTTLTAESLHSCHELNHPLHSLRTVQSTTHGQTLTHDTNLHDTMPLQLWRCTTNARTNILQQKTDLLSCAYFKHNVHITKVVLSLSTKIYIASYVRQSYRQVLGASLQLITRTYINTINNSRITRTSFKWESTHIPSFILLEVSSLSAFKELF